MVYRLKSAFIVALLAFILCGCWDYQQLNSTLLTSGLALDYKDNQYTVTTEIIKLSGDKSGSTESCVLSASGDSETMALSEIQGDTPGFLNTNHLDTLVMGEEFAKHGIAYFIEGSIRNTNFQITTDFVVAKNGTAEEVLRQKPQIEQLQAYEISDMIDSEYLQESKSRKVTAFELNNIFAGETSAVLPVVTVEDKKVKPDGLAYFKKDRLAGYIEDDQTPYYLFAVNDIKRAHIKTNLGSKESVITSVIQSSTHQQSSFMGGKPKITLEIKADLSLVSLKSDLNLGEKSAVKMLEDRISKGIAEDVLALIRNFQKHTDCDIFGFANTFTINDRDYWDTVKDKWPEVFKELDVEVNVDAKIVNTLLLLNSNETAKKRAEK